MSNATKFPFRFVQIAMKWNIAPRRAKRTKKGSDLVSSTFND